MGGKNYGWVERASQKKISSDKIGPVYLCSYYFLPFGYLTNGKYEHQYLHVDTFKLVLYLLAFHMSHNLKISKKLLWPHLFSNTPLGIFILHH